MSKAPEETGAPSGEGSPIHDAYRSTQEGAEQAVQDFAQAVGDAVHNATDSASLATAVQAALAHNPYTTIFLQSMGVGLMPERMSAMAEMLRGAVVGGIGDHVAAMQEAQETGNIKAYYENMSEALNKASTIVMIVSSVGSAVSARVGSPAGGAKGRAGTTIADEGGVRVKSHGSNDVHKPAHAHVKGGGREVRIGPNGKPLKGQPELSPKQAKVVDDNRQAIRKELRKVGRANQGLEQQEKAR